MPPGPPPSTLSGPYARLSAALRRALGPAGSTLAADAAAEARRLAGVAAVRGPPAVTATEAGAQPSPTTMSPAGPPLTTAGAAGLASDWAALVDAVQDHHELLTSYDIGVDREARQREDVRRSAARVGLRLPPEEE